MKLLLSKKIDETSKPAAFGRLCVETINPRKWTSIRRQPPSGGCVLKQQVQNHIGGFPEASRLRAAVC